MSESTPRLRMFAGPNGSGKSTLKSYLPPALLGVYLNLDEIEQEIRRRGYLDFSTYFISPTAEEAGAFFNSSSFLKDEGLGEKVRKLQFMGGRVNFEEVEVNSYFASVAVDFLRQKLLEHRISFTFETVMSHPGKVDLLAQARRTLRRNRLTNRT